MTQKAEGQATAVNEGEQDRSMARLAEILEVEGVKVHRYNDEQEHPLIMIEGDGTERDKAAEIASGLGYQLVRIGEVRYYPKVNGSFSRKDSYSHWTLNFSSTSK